MTKKLLTIILVLLLAVPVHAFTPDGLVGDWKLTGQTIQRQGTIIDRTGTTNPGTVFGAPAIDFDGTDDKAAVTTEWDALNGHRYAVIAIHANATADTVKRILYVETWTGDTKAKIEFSISATTDFLRIACRSGAGADTSRAAESTGALTEGSWQTILALIDLGTDGTVANGAAVRIWVNGLVFPMGAFNGDLTQGTFASDTPGSQIFGLNTGGNRDFTGQMQWLGYGGSDTAVTIVDALRFHENPQAWLTQSGLDAFWFCKDAALAGTADNGEGTAGRDLALTNAGWDVTDNGGNAYANSGGAGDSFTAGKRWFDGTDDYVSVANAASLVFGTADFQIHAWVSISNTGADPETILEKGDDSNEGWRIQHNAGTITFGAGINRINLSGGAVPDNTPTLISVLRTGSDASLLINGASVSTDASATKDITDTTASTIGKGFGPSFFTGDIYRVLIGTKSATIAEGTADAKAIFEQGAFK